ncbi:hypothetical protein Tco_0514833 [Tanacetum coccineum]
MKQLRKSFRSRSGFKLHEIDRRAMPIGGKCFVDEPLAIPLDEIQIDDKLNFIEEPVEIMDREVKRLKQSRITIMKPNTGKHEKERRACLDYLKYEESRVRIKCESISKKKKSNYSSFHALRSSCNEDMVKYEEPRPSTTQTRALNERFNKKISPARTQPPGWSVCRPTESLLPGRRLCRPALGAHVFHFTLEETWIIKKDLDPLN